MHQPLKIFLKKIFIRNFWCQSGFWKQNESGISKNRGPCEGLNSISSIHESHILLLKIEINGFHGFFHRLFNSGTEMKTDSKIKKKILKITKI